MSEEAIRNVRASFWTRHFPVNPLMIVGVAVVIIVFVALPIYLYTNKFKGNLSSCAGALSDNSTSSTPQARVLFEDGELHKNVYAVKWG
jgi:CRISPR/Cas system-associated protein Cas7 (RAMP superfamily)